MAMWRRHWLWWTCLVAAAAAAAAAGQEAVMVSCEAPTRLAGCGLRAALLPPPAPAAAAPGAGSACRRLCGGRAVLQRGAGRWWPCEARGGAGARCEARAGAARVLLRCADAWAEATVRCAAPAPAAVSAPARTRRRADEGDAISEGAGGDDHGGGGDVDGDGTGEAASEEEVAAEESADTTEPPPPTATDPAVASTVVPEEGAATETPSVEETPAPAPAEPPTDPPTEPPADPPDEAPTETAPAEAPTESAEVGVETAGAEKPQVPSVDGDGGELEQTLTVALGALVAILVVGVAVGGFVYWRWRRQPAPRGARAPGDGAEEKPLSRRVAVSALELYVAAALCSEELRDQHALLPRGCVRPALCGRRPENRRRNRYNDLVAYDESRVVLEAFPGEDPLPSDYINANYVDGYERPREFIAAQAPTAATAADWWRMVWQQRVRVVVALCMLREGGVEKCFQYWPAAGGAAAHGAVAVTCAREDAFPDVVVRELRATRAHETRQVVQVQFTAWPDHGVPRHPEAVTALLRRVERARAAARAGGAAAEPPLLVHCSAGVGRTGTVLLAELALEQARAEGAVDMLALLQRMRRQRPNLVDSSEQYEAAHRILVDALLGAPLALPADAALGARVREAAAAGELRAQWRRLEFAASVAAAGAATGTGGPALLELDGFRARGRYVAAPAAAPATAWRQVAARGLRVVVLLQEPPAGEGPWPADPGASDVGVRVLDGGARVSVLGPPPSAAHAGDVAAVQEQRLELRAGGVEGRSLRLLRLRARWPASADVPEGGARPLLRLWRAASAAANAVATSAAAAATAAASAPASALAVATPVPEPVLLLCADGRRGCGLFAALSALLEQLQAEGECCVAEAVHAVRRSHDGLLCSEEQLVFLYEAAVCFVEDAVAAGATR